MQIGLSFLLVTISICSSLQARATRLSCPTCKFKKSSSIPAEAVVSKSVCERMRFLSLALRRHQRFVRAARWLPMVHQLRIAYGYTNRLFNVLKSKRVAMLYVQSKSTSPRTEQSMRTQTRRYCLWACCNSTNHSVLLSQATPVECFSLMPIKGRRTLQVAAAHCRASAGTTETQLWSTLRVE